VFFHFVLKYVVDLVKNFLSLRKVRLLF